MGKTERKRIIHITLRDEEDKKLCQYAARINKFRNMAEWMRAIINCHLNMSNLRPLKYIGQYRTHCKNGHKFTKENSIQMIDKKTGRKFKICRTCKRLSCKKYYKMRKERKLSGHQYIRERSA